MQRAYALCTPEDPSTPEHLLRNSNITTCVIQGFIKSYMQNILLIALAKDQCKNFTNLQLLFLNFALVVERV